MSECLLEIREVHKTFQKGDERIDVLTGANLKIERGDALSIVGASGAGKSTLLHIMGTLDMPDQGEVFYEDKNLCTLSSPVLADFRNQHLGFVFQFHHLLPEFSALENVMMPALIRRMSRQEAQEKARRVLDEVGLAKRLEHKPGELSGGEQQRVALARALILNPPLLLADEVTGNLDQNTGEEIHKLLADLNEDKGITIVVVTHNESLARSMKRQITLHEGQLVEADV